MIKQVAENFGIVPLTRTHKESGLVDTSVGLTLESEDAHLIYAIPLDQVDTVIEDLKRIRAHAKQMQTYKPGLEVVR